MGSWTSCWFAWTLTQIIKGLVLAQAIGVRTAFVSVLLSLWCIHHVLVGFFITKLQQIILASWSDISIAFAQSVDVQRHGELMIIVVLRLSGVPDLELSILQQLLRSFILDLYWNVCGLRLLIEYTLVWIDIEILFLSLVVRDLCFPFTLRLSRWIWFFIIRILLWKDVHRYRLVVLRDRILELDCVEFGDTWWWHDDLSLGEDEEAAVQACDEDLRLGVEHALVDKVRVGLQLASRGRTCLILSHFI